MVNHPNRGGANRRLAEAAGYSISEGAYQSTTDDRLGRWYVQAPGQDYIDRRGPGHASRAQAWAAAAEHAREST